MLNMAMTQSAGDAEVRDRGNVDGSAASETSPGGRDHPRTSDPRNAVIIGSGNIGTDLLEKVLRRSDRLNVVAMVGIDPESDGLRRASSRGVKTFANGLAEMLADPSLPPIDVAFDATSARAHHENAGLLEEAGIPVVDLTPAAIGPFVVPAVNLPDLTGIRNVNMVTCGGQATVPVVAAIASVAPVPYAEIVASISSRSAGPGTRKNIDEFTQTTAEALEVVGGAERGKAMIILNPAHPPVMMRNTVYCLTLTDSDEDVARAVQSMVETVGSYVPGYTLKQEVQVESLDRDDPRRSLAGAHSDRDPMRLVSVYLEVTGNGDYLPTYAGNLDIMTSAALRVGEELIATKEGI